MVLSSIIETKWNPAHLLKPGLFHSRIKLLMRPTRTVGLALTCPYSHIRETFLRAIRFRLQVLLQLNCRLLATRTKLLKRHNCISQPFQTCRFSTIRTKMFKIVNRLTTLWGCLSTITKTKLLRGPNLINLL